MITANPPSPHLRQQNKAIDVRQLYHNRFDKKQGAKQAVWKVLCGHFFQRFIPQEACVMDIAVGNCEFINHIEAHEKIAFAINAYAAIISVQNKNRYYHTNSCCTDGLFGNFLGGDGLSSHSKRHIL
jgi:hypothetical protein